jgi:hyaluronoglucosaminidase
MSDIFPAPIHVIRTAELGTIHRIHYEGDSQEWADMVESYKEPLDGQAKLDVEIHVGDTPPNKKFHVLRRHLLQEEGYYIEIQKTANNRALIWITAMTDRGYSYAFWTWKQLITKSLYEGYIMDYPLMPIRGMVEGYYGTPWTTEQRVSVFKLMNAEKMNTYVYAPKNDRYHRDAWSIPYPDKELRQLEVLFGEASHHHIDFVYSVGPGLSMIYSSEQHLDLLMQKFRQLYDKGTRYFALLLDDIPMTLLHQEDVRHFSSFEEAHIHLVQVVYSRLKEWDTQVKLMVCPTLYFGRAEEDYIQRLGQSIPRDVELMWTGKAICSPEIDVGEAREFYELTSKRPLYWDNYPVNDANMRDEMHIGPILNRHPKLYQYSNGLIANVMEYPESTLLPLITIAHYLWNPPAYHADSSYRYALRSQVGSTLEHSFMRISECINQSSLHPYPGQTIITKWFEIQGKWSNQTDSKKEFIQYLQSYTQDIEKVRSMKNKKLVKELEPWLRELNKDLEYIMDVMEAAQELNREWKKQKLEQVKMKTDQLYKDRAKALGFFPYLIANEILLKESMPDNE